MASANLDLDVILAFTVKLARDVCPASVSHLVRLILDQAGAMIRNGQEERFASEAAEDSEKVNSVDVSGSLFTPPCLKS